MLPGHHIKNLFLRNKKEAMWLVVALEDRAIDLKQLGEALGAGRLSFGSPERLRTYLGVEPGSVTPFSVINDTGAQGAPGARSRPQDGRADQRPSAHQHHDDRHRAARPAALLRSDRPRARWLDFPLLTGTGPILD